MPIVTKNVKGKQYIYYSFYDSDKQKKKEIYCGGVDTDEAKRKALETELEYLKKQKEELVSKINGIEKKLKKLS